jgi:hypothetical protein
MGHFFTQYFEGAKKFLMLSLAGQLEKEGARMNRRRESVGTAAGSGVKSIIISLTSLGLWVPIVRLGH